MERSDLPVDTLAAVFAPPPPTWNLTEHDDGLLHAITDDLVCVTFKNSNAPTEVRDLLEKSVDLVGLIR